MACGLLQAGSRNQASKAAQGWSASGWFSVASSMVVVVRAVARAVGTAGAKAIASITNVAAETVIAILLNMIHPSGQTHRFVANRRVRRSDHHHRKGLFILDQLERHVMCVCRLRDAEQLTRQPRAAAPAGRGAALFSMAPPPFPESTVDD